MSKLSTTSSSLFTKQNKAKIPAWMKDVEWEENEKEALPIDFDSKGLFAEKTAINRDMHDGTLREVTANLNTSSLQILAKIELAKFLSGKYYNTTASVDGNKVIFKTAISNVPADFEFVFINKNGHLNKTATFSIDTKTERAEYPFSAAGLDECLNDIKTGSVKSEKLAPAGNPTTITLAEIVRRFNGDTRAAMDAARKRVKEGNIVGVGSNTYASFYSMDTMFPLLEKKEKCPKKQAAAEFVKNTEHVAAVTHTSAQVLSIDASKTLAKLFDDFIIENSMRDNNELLIKAKVLTKSGKNETIDFSFGIQNDKVDSIRFAEMNNHRYSIDQVLNNVIGSSNVLDEYLANNKKTAKRIYRGIVITAKEFHNKLAGVVSKQTTNKIINNLLERNIIEEINSTTFSTTHSFEDLLASVNTKLLTKEEKENVKEFSKKIASNIDRLEQEDTGIRNDNELQYSKSIRLASIYNKLSTRFDEKFTINNISDDCTTFDIGYYDGYKNDTITCEASFNNNEVKELKYDKQHESIQAVQMYMEDNLNKTASLRLAKSVFSKATLKSILLRSFKEQDVNNIANTIIASKQFSIEEIGNNLFASKMPLANIIYTIEKNNIAKPMTGKEKLEVTAQKNRKNSDLDRINIDDTGFRNDVERTFSESIRLANAYNRLANVLKNFKITDHTPDCTAINIMNFENGIKTNMKCTASFVDNTIKDMKLKSDDNKVGIDVIKLYNEDFSGNKVYAKSVFSDKMLKKALASSFGTNDINKLASMIVTSNKFGVKELTDSLYASNSPLSDIIYTLAKCVDIKPMAEADKKEILAAKAFFGKAIDRNYETDTGIRDVDYSDTEAEFMTKINRKIASYFGSFKPIAAKMNDDVLDYKVALFDDTTGLSINIDLVCNKQLEIKASLNGKIVAVDNVKKAFESNDVLNKYLVKNSSKKFNAPIVVSLNKLVADLRMVTDATNENIEKCLSNWLAMKKIERIGSNTFVSKYTLEQLIATSSLKPLTEDEYNKRLAKSVKNKLLKVSQSFEKDGDTRILDKDWDAARMLAFINKDIADLKYGKHTIKSFDIDKDKVAVTASVDTDGILTDMHFEYKIKDGKLTSSHTAVRHSYDKDHNETDKEYHNKLFGLNAVNRIDELNGKHEAAKIVITENQLFNKLKPVINVNDFKSIVAKLESDKIITRVANGFVSDHSIVSIANMLDNDNLTNLSSGNNMLNASNVQTKKFSLEPSKLDDASRQVEAKEDSLNGKLKIAKEALIKNIGTARNGLLITDNKEKTLTNSVTAATTVYELENVIKELKKYLHK